MYAFVMQACSLSSECKRKLHDIDITCERPFPWGKAKRQRKSCFDHNHYALSESCLDGFFEVYSKCKTTSQDGVSDDVLMVTMGGGQPDEPNNANLDKVVTQFKNQKPKLQKPRIGTIELTEQDALRRQGRPKALFTAMPDDNIVFTMERPGPIATNQFQFLQGSASYNKWRVPGIQFAQLPKAQLSDLHHYFISDAGEIPLRDDGNVADANADQLSLREDEVIPFPREHSYLLRKEAIQVFGVGCVIIYYAGSGESCKAVLVSNIRAIVICESVAQRSWIQENLRNFVKVQRLVSADSRTPQKPKELVKWEEDAAKKKASAIVAAPQNSTLVGFRPDVLRTETVATPNLIVAPEPTAEAKPVIKPPTLLAGFGAGKL